jgi:hypothetical protein
LDLEEWQCYTRLNTLSNLHITDSFVSIDVAKDLCSKYLESVRKLCNSDLSIYILLGHGSLATCLLIEFSAQHWKDALQLGPSAVHSALSRDKSERKPYIHRVKRGLT